MWLGLWLGILGRGGCWEGKPGTGDLNGQGIVLLAPFSDQRPQGRIGGEDAVRAVTGDPRWREDRGQAIEELESGEAQGGAAGEVGFRHEVENLVGAAALGSLVSRVRKPGLSRAAEIRDGFSTWPESEQETNVVIME